MNLKKATFGVLGIRSGEGRRVAWLVAHSLFIGVFSAFFLTAANALFLERFETTYLPLAYIGAGLVGYVALMLFSRLQKAVSLQRTLVANVVFLFVVAAVLWLLTLATNNRWVVFFMFVWVGPAFSMLALGYWALAGRLFDLRQGKRLFGLVGAGEEVSTVLGLFSVPLLLRFLGGPQHLLPIALVGLLGCLVVVIATAAQFREALALGATQQAQAPGEGQPAGLGAPAAQSLLPAAGLAGHLPEPGQLRRRLRLPVPGPRALPGGAQLAQFIGLFFGVTKTLELLAKVFLSGRLINQFGLGFGLLAVPVLLATCVGFAIAIGVLGLPAAHFFVLVALSKLVWIVSRTTTFEPSFRVLYQPVGAERLAFQTHAEGTARQLAIGIVGVALLLLSRGTSFDALKLFYALVPLLAVWAVASVLAHRDYRKRLLDSLTARPRQPSAQAARRAATRPALGRPRRAGARVLAAAASGGPGVQPEAGRDAVRPRAAPAGGGARARGTRAAGRSPGVGGRVAQRRPARGAAGGAQRARPAARGGGADGGPCRGARGVGGARRNGRSPPRRSGAAPSRRARSCGCCCSTRSGSCGGPRSRPPAASGATSSGPRSSAS